MPERIANRYVIESLVGQGGMADVYRAHDEILNRTVAIKVLRAKLADDPLVLVRFTREASAASKLSHPNVVDIYDVGEGSGLHYIVMEFVKGTTLKQMISRRGALDMQEALSIMKQLVSGVAAAHASQIIHRDIKPQNIMIKADGTVKITDFGIAVATGSVALTHNNAVMGSAHYLAPESARGKAPDVRVDIYSLGIVFYELLTNQVPFSGTSPAEIAFKHMQQEMPRVRDFNPTLPQSIENIIIKATAKDPNERYSTADAMLEDLNHALDPDRIHARPLVLKTVTMNPNGTPNPQPQKKRPGRYRKTRKRETDSRSTADKRTADTRSERVHTTAAVMLSILIGLILVAGSLGCGLLRIPGVMGYVRIPDVSSLSAEDAAEILENAGFTSIHTDEKLDDTVAAGQVIDTDIPAGEVVRQSDPLSLIVSRGPSYLVPDFTGLSLVQVQSRLAQNKVDLDMEVIYEGAPDTNPGIVLRQEILSPGERIDPQAHTPIRLIVSSYPTIEISEDLIGMDVNEAKSQLNAQGIAVVLKNAYGGTTVVETDPAIGSSYTQEGTDSVVTLYH